MTALAIAIAVFGALVVLQLGNLVEVLMSVLEELRRLRRSLNDRR